MIRQVKAVGARVELITNGILLNEKRLFGLIEAGLDLLWISLDGASAEGYGDIRLGGSFERVVQNLKRLPEIRMRAGFQHDHRPQLGIAFVAMKRNIADLPPLFRLGAELGVRHYSISNVLAHTPELSAEVLYNHSLHNHASLFNTSRSVVNMPRIDFNSLTQQSLGEILARKDVFLTAGKESQRAVDVCQFIEQGSTAVRWDGAVCPCIPLLHTSEHYLEHRLRTTHSHVFGTLEEKDQLEIWNDPEYLALRKRIQSFNFSPCTFCNGCGLSLDNQEDCMSNPAPTCGGCLWAQGFIQCP